MAAQAAIMADFDEDEDFSNSPSSGILLGFAEKTDNPLLSPYFPSKIGGKPAWLNLRDIPEAPKCKECGDVLSFLLQVYAPRQGEETFHRSIYLFCCTKASCLESNKSVVAYRSQLKRKNEFYPSFPITDVKVAQREARIEEILSKAKGLCAVCGVRSPMQCSRCKKVNYCSRAHQLAHWKAGHKQACSCNQKVKSTKRANIALEKLVYPEMELIIEDEYIEDIEDAKENLKFDKEKKLLSNYEAEVAKMSKADLDKEDKAFLSDEKLLKAFKGVEANAIREAVMQDANKNKEKKSRKIPNELSKEAREKAEIKENDVDLVFEKFQAYVKANPDQVLRYRSQWDPEVKKREEKKLSIDEPLWICKHGQAKNVPKCEKCGKDRKFEFQVMPQLLNYLNVDATKKNSLDWGVLVVYTCPDSCGDGGKEYFPEFVHCQMVTE